MKVRLALLLSSLILASSALGQILNVGRNPSTTNTGAGGSGVLTLVDRTTPANANGTPSAAPAWRSPAHTYPR
jgi:hypothetical protein